MNMKHKPKLDRTQNMTNKHTCTAYFLVAIGIGSPCPEA